MDNQAAEIKSEAFKMEKLNSGAENNAEADGWMSEQDSNGSDKATVMNEGNQANKEEQPRPKAYCPECGKGLAGVETTCPFCGYPLEKTAQATSDCQQQATQPQAQQPSQSSQQSGKGYGWLGTISGILGTIAGIIGICWGLGIKGSTIGSLESNSAYGGDAYTGIQNAAAQAATNIYYLNHVVANGFYELLVVIGLALIAAGLALIAYFLPKALGKK